jgi:hypothetical protein
VQNHGGQYEYRDQPSDSLPDPASIQSEPKQQSSIGARYPLASTPVTVYSNTPSFILLQSSPKVRKPEGRTTPINSPHSFDLDDLSNPSNKEFFLQNINQDVSRDVPLLVVD